MDRETMADSSHTLGGTPEIRWSYAAADSALLAPRACGPRISIHNPSRMHRRGNELTTARNVDRTIREYFVLDPLWPAGLAPIWWQSDVRYRNASLFSLPDRETERLNGPSSHSIGQQPTKSRDESEEKRKCDERTIFSQPAKNQIGSRLSWHRERLWPRFLLHHRGLDISRTDD